jgi:hypothetical protein
MWVSPNVGGWSDYTAEMRPLLTKALHPANKVFVILTYNRGKWVYPAKNGKRKGDACFRQYEARKSTCCDFFL